MNDPLTSSSSNTKNSGTADSPSAYASAESSPTQSMVTSLSMHGGMSNNGVNLDDEFVLVSNSPHRMNNMPVSQSMNSFASCGSGTTTTVTANPVSPQLLNLSAIPNSMSVSGIDALAKLEELNMQGFTSLPPPVAASPTSGVKVAPGETVKSVIERTVLSEMDKSPKSAQNTSPRSSSVFSMLGRIFKSGSKTTDEKSSKLTTSPSSSASSSSPNPETSPFKLLEGSDKSSGGTNEQQSAINPDVKEAALVFGGAVNATTPIDKLMNDVDEHDPILSPSSSSDAARSSSTVQRAVESPKSSRHVVSQSNGGEESLKVPASSHEFCMALNLNIATAAARAADAPVAICENGKSTKHQQQQPSTNDHQRFTKNASTSSIHNDLKAILEESKESVNNRTAATASSGEQTETTTPSRGAKSSPSKKRNTPKSGSKSEKKEKQQKEKEKEKEKEVKEKDSETATSKKEDDKISPSKREKKNRNKNSKTSEKKTEQKDSVEKSSLKSTSSLESKMNMLELLMKTAAAASMGGGREESSNNNSNSPSHHHNHHHHKSNNKHGKHHQQQPQRNPFRYSHEFLLRIRQERSKLIDNICPDIFRTHAYCISGTYWEPEKYFNAMLHGERLFDFVNNNNNTTPNQSTGLKSSVSSQHVKSIGYQQHAQRTYYNNNKYENNNGRKWTRKNQAETRSSESELIKPASWSSLPHQSISNTANSNVLSDKYLLDLLKSNNNTSSAQSAQSAQSGQSPRTGVDLMSMINKKQQQPQQQEEKKSSAPRHSPLILTAQELEFSQMFSSRNSGGAMKKQHHQHQQVRSSPGQVNQHHHQQTSPASSGSRSSNLSPSSGSSSTSNSHQLVGSLSADELENNNSSDAYKQLVRNLSNHPLSSMPNSRASQNAPAVDQLFNMVEKVQKSTEKSPENGANLLKQLLKLNLSSSASNEELVSSSHKQSQQYYQHRQQHQHHYHNNQYQANHRYHNNHHSYNNNNNYHHHNNQYQNNNQYNRFGARPKLNSSGGYSSYNTNNKPMMSRKSPSSDNFKSLMQKLNGGKAGNEQEHFSMLLDKLMPSLSNHIAASASSTGGQPPKSTDDVMKWFRSAVASSSSSTQK